MLTVTAADTVIKRQHFNQPALDKSKENQLKKLVRHAAKIPMIKCVFSVVGKQAKECVCPSVLCRSLVLVNFQYSLNYYCNLQQMILL